MMFMNFGIRDGKTLNLIKINKIYIIIDREIKNN